MSDARQKTVHGDTDKTGWSTRHKREQRYEMVILRSPRFRPGIGLQHEDYYAGCNRDGDRCIRHGLRLMLGGRDSHSTFFDWESGEAGRLAQSLARWQADPYEIVDHGWRIFGFEARQINELKASGMDADKALRTVLADRPSDWWEQAKRRRY